MGVHTFNVEGYSVNGEGCSVCRMIIKLFFCCFFFSNLYARDNGLGTGWAYAVIFCRWIPILAFTLGRLL